MQPGVHRVAAWSTYGCRRCARLASRSTASASRSPRRRRRRRALRQPAGVGRVALGHDRPAWQPPQSSATRLVARLAGRCGSHLCEAAPGITATLACGAGGRLKLSHTLRHPGRRGERRGEPEARRPHPRRRRAQGERRGAAGCGGARARADARLGAASGGRARAGGHVWRHGLMSGAIAMAIRQCLRAGTRRRGAVLHGRGGGGGKRMVRRSGGEMGDWIGWLGVCGVGCFTSWRGAAGAGDSTHFILGSLEPSVAYRYISICVWLGLHRFKEYGFRS